MVKFLNGQESWSHRYFRRPDVDTVLSIFSVYKYDRPSPYFIFDELKLARRRG